MLPKTEQRWSLWVDLLTIILESRARPPPSLGHYMLCLFWDSRPGHVAGGCRPPREPGMALFRNVPKIIYRDPYAFQVILLIASAILGSLGLSTARTMAATERTMVSMCCSTSRRRMPVPLDLPSTQNGLCNCMTDFCVYIVTLGLGMYYSGTWTIWVLYRPMNLRFNSTKPSLYTP